MMLIRAGLLLGLVSVATGLVWGQPYVRVAGSSKGYTVNLATGSITEEPAEVVYPMGVATAPDGKRTYWLTAAGVVAVGGPSVVTIPLSVSIWFAVFSSFFGSAPSYPAIAVSPGGSQLYVGAADGVDAFDVLTDRWVKRLKPPEFASGDQGQNSSRLVFSPDGKRLYASNGDVISVIDTASNTSVGVIDTQDTAALAVSPEGSSLYVATQWFDCLFSAVSAIATATGNARNLDTVCAGAMALAPNGRRLYAGSNPVRVYDLDAGTQVGAIRVDGDDLLNDLAFTPDGKQLIAATRAGLTLIDVASNRVINGVNIPGGAIRIAMVPQVPELAVGGVLQTAGARSSFSPGSIVSLYGSDLAHGILAASGSTLPESLLQTSVYIGNVRAPLFFVSNQQINAFIPYETSPGPASIRVERNGLSSRSESISIQDVSPGIFAPVAHADANQPVSSLSPAHAGEYLVLYAEGLGRLAEKPQVTIGGVRAPMISASLAPGFPGIYQVQVQVPDDAPNGAAVPISLTILGVTSNQVEIAIQ